jgi:hypothetical protein
MAPLDEKTDEGVAQFYADAEAVLARVPRRGMPMILNQADGSTVPCDSEACSAGAGAVWTSLRVYVRCVPPRWMTELEEAELTNGQGRVLSGHLTQTTCTGPAKRTLAGALPATRKRHTHAGFHEGLWNIHFRVRCGISIQNAGGDDDIAIA